MTTGLRRLPWFSFVLLALVPIIGPEVAADAAAQDVTVAEPAVRFPFDPVCPWGRVADGRGMLVRCLDAVEARRLAVGNAAPRGDAPAAAPASEPQRRLDPPALAAPAPAPRPARRVVLESVGPALADTGDLPEAQAQLRRASERYVSCAEANGGLTSSPARVTVRFLVRERGRAEGITVKDRLGLSVSAAKCIADVIDRRYVGYPAAPIVGADVTIELGWEGSRR